MRGVLSGLLFWKKLNEEQTVFLKLLFANWGVAVLQLVPGILTGALSMLAGGLHAFSDGTTNIIAIVSIHTGKRLVAILFILGFMVYLVVQIIARAIEGIRNPQVLDIPWFFLAFLMVTVVADYCIARYEFKKGKELDSKLLTCDAMHTKGHYLATSAVILGILLIKLGAPPIIDPIVSVVVAIFICKLIYEVCQESWPNLFRRRSCNNN